MGGRDSNLNVQHLIFRFLAYFSHLKVDLLIASNLLGTLTETHNLLILMSFANHNGNENIISRTLTKFAGRKDRDKFWGALDSTKVQYPHNYRAI